MRLLSCASAGEKGRSAQEDEGNEQSGKTMHGALRACSRRTSRAQIRRWLNMDATGGSAVPLVPATYGRSGYRNENNSRLIVRSGKRRHCPFGSIRRQDRDRYRISLVPLICSTNGLAEISYFMVLRMPSQSVAPLKAFRLQKMSVLHQIDPAAGGQADGIEAGLRRGFEIGKAGKGAFLRRAFGRRGQLGIGRRTQGERHPGGRQRGEFAAGRKLDAIRRGQRRALVLDVPFELVAAARLLCRPCRSGPEQHNAIRRGARMVNPPQS